nr:hypothetical protein [Roseivirga echinicomitans]
MEPTIGEKRMIESHNKLALPDLNLDLDKSTIAQTHKLMVSKITARTNMSVIPIELM